MATYQDPHRSFGDSTCLDFYEYFSVIRNHPTEQRVNVRRFWYVPDKKTSLQKHLSSNLTSNKPKTQQTRSDLDSVFFRSVLATGVSVEEF